MDCSTPGLSVLHHLPKFPQVHVHCINDAIQPSDFSDTLFSFCPQSFPASGTFPVSPLFTSDDQYTRVSASPSVLPMSIQGWSPLILTALTSLLSKGLSGVFSSTTVWRHQFFGTLPLYSPALTTVHDHWEDHSLDYMDLRGQNNVSAFQHSVLADLSQLSCQEAIIFWFHSCSHHPQWLQSPGRGNPSISTFSPSICHAVMGLDAMILGCVFFSLKPAL